MCVAEKVRRSIVVWGVHVIEPAMELLLRMSVCMFIDQSLELLEVCARVPMTIARSRVDHSLLAVTCPQLAEVD